MVDRPELLAEVLPRLQQSDWIALDTEADSIHCYPERLCLLQFSFAGGEVLIDPLARLDLSPLLQVLRDRELILHGADYDLRLLYRGLGYVPAKVFDTMLAARFLGLREFGLTDLAARFLGIRLVKGPQKANWTRRPLTPEMIEYALNDTRHLKRLADLLRQQLAVLGRLTWHQETCDRLIEECSRPRQRNLDQAWRLPGSDRLAPPALAVLRALWHWREQEAVRTNKPPFFVLSHDALISLSIRAVHHQKLDELIPGAWPTPRRQALHRAMEKALAQPESQFPQPLRARNRRFTDSENHRLNDLRRRRDAAARRLGLEPAFIASRSTLISLIRQGAESDLMQWQQQLLLSPSP